MPELIQFKFSHFCEKARWALDYKDVPYTVRNLLPGSHREVTSRLCPRSCLPILVDGETVVQDSTEIINYLERSHKHRSLAPDDEAAARAALEWEEYLDQEIGVPLRCWFYYHALPSRDHALRFLLDGAAWHERMRFSFAFPKIRVAMVKAMQIDAASAQNAEQRFAAALDRIDRTLATRSFLAGSRFSRADLTACALLSPYVRPGETDRQASRVLASAVNARRLEDKSRPFYRWVCETYGTYRKQPAH
jgi:glutathione S-transferase